VEFQSLQIFKTWMDMVLGNLLDSLYLLLLWGCSIIREGEREEKVRGMACW